MKKIICSPKLVLSEEKMDLVGCEKSKKSGHWVCVSELSKLVEWPSAKFYWLEVGMEQWSDKSGIAIYLRLFGGDDLQCKVNKKVPVWLWCHISAEKAARKWLGDHLLSKTGVKVYFRLIYR